jgi:hypothetical protein
MGKSIPQGIEVLVAKASLDPEFKLALLERRAVAAESIGLVLVPAEAAMLASVPRGQLEAIIASTRVPQEHRRAFLGQAAATMLAAVAVMRGSAWAEPNRERLKPGGIDPGLDWLRRDAEEAIQWEVHRIVAKRFDVDSRAIKFETSLRRVYLPDPKKLAQQIGPYDDEAMTVLRTEARAETASREVRKRHFQMVEDLRSCFRLPIPAEDWTKFNTVGDVVAYVVKHKRDDVMRELLATRRYRRD